VFGASKLKENDEKRRLKPSINRFYLFWRRGRD